MALRRLLLSARVSAAVAVVATSGFLVASGSANAETVQQVQAQIAAVQAKLNALNVKAEATAEAYNGARIQLAAANQAAAAAKARAAKASVALSGLQEQVGAFAAAAYRTGGMNKLTALTESGPAQLLDEWGSLSAVSRRQADVLHAANVARHQMLVAQAAAADAVTAQQRITARLASQKAQVQADTRTAQRLLLQLEATERQLAAQAKAAADRRAAALRAAQLAAEAAAVQQSAATFNSQPVVNPPPPPGPPPPAGSAAAVAVAWAYRELGKPYVFGAAGPNAFDCSGLTMYVWGQAGVSLSHYTGAQWNEGTHVSMSQLQPGDLVFFYAGISHVGIYVGGGEFIHAPHTGTVVSLASLSGYYAANFVGAVRPTG